MQKKLTRLCAISVAALFITSSYAGDNKNEEKVVVKSFELPLSNLRSVESLKAPTKKEFGISFRRLIKEKGCTFELNLEPSKLPAARQCLLDVYYESDHYKVFKAKYNARIKEKKIADVQTIEALPADGISEKNKNRVLIDLHGGVYDWGSVHELLMNTPPVAALGRIKVISIDFAKAPHHRFPAASKDVAAVYRELLKSYKPENIGIYGCTLPSLAGASMAWFLKEKLPLPGAIGMLCGGTGKLGGDSMHISGAITGYDFPSFFEKIFSETGAYFEGVDMTNPLILPDQSEAILKQFPPTLLFGTIRGFALSSVVQTHRKLVNLGVEAELHVWEGMQTGFHQEPMRPETDEAYRMIVNFFDKHLGRP